MREKFIYRIYKTKFKFNNLLYIYFKNKSYRGRNNKFFKNISKNISAEKKENKFILFKILFIKILKYIKFITSSLSINKITFYL